MNLIQIHTPTTEKSDEELDDFFKEIDRAIKSTKRNKTNIYSKKINKLCRQTPRIRNQKLSGCTVDTTNMWFRVHKRRLYIWESLQNNEEGITRNTTL